MKGLIVAGLVLSLLWWTPLGAEGLGDRTLQKGLSGPDVVELQQVLNDFQFSLDVDGIFGKQTEKAVRRFQAALGLTPDGIVGPDTMEMIRFAENHAVIYEVKTGDTLYDLAKVYGATVKEICQLNGLSSNLIQPGQKLTVLARNGTKEHVVRRGESLSQIAHQFGVATADLMEANKLTNPHRLRVGQTLLIPNPAAGRGGTSRAEEAVTASAAAGSPSRTTLNWPVQGPISSPYGWRTHPVRGSRHFHAGIDIAVPQGTPVKAAADGVVRTAGWMGAYGRGVVIDHGAGLSTWYGHNSQLVVRTGERVQAGQVIAYAGSSGVSTGPHLDFRIKIGEQTVDPLDWLP